MHPTIYYIRHGETDWNAELRFQGRQDIPLNDTGRQQADRNGKTLSQILPAGKAFPFVSSPMIRARETMERVQAAAGLARLGYTTDERLIEASYGDWEGRRLPEVKRDFPELHRQRKLQRWTFSPPNGESHEMLEDRVNHWLGSLQEDHVVVAHGVIGRVLRYLLLDIDPQTAGEFRFPQDKICIITRGSEAFV